MTATVAVLGPGAVGGVLAVPLALAGNRVICIGRAEAVAAIAEEGLTLDRCGELLQAHPETAELLREPVELLLVTVKAPGLGEALDRVTGEPAIVVPLMNGIEHVDAIRARFGARVVTGSIGGLESFREGRTRIVQTTPAPIVMLASEDDPARAERAGDLIRTAGVKVNVDNSEKAVIWAKLARLAPLAAATALTQRSVGELRDDSEWRRTLAAGVDETCAVAGADGIEINAEAEWEIIDTMPGELTTSTARDVAAGRPSELDAIVGGVVRAGRRLGIPTPTLERLLAEEEGR